MIVDAVAETAPRSGGSVADVESNVVPYYVVAMLRNVRLCVEKTTPPLEHEGDFWCWKLTAYGRAMMRALVRTSESGFSFAETFMQPDPKLSPQLVCLQQFNELMQTSLSASLPLADMKRFLDDSPYLHEQQVATNLEAFQHEIERLTRQIREGLYDPAGNSVHGPRNRGQRH